MQRSANRIHISTAVRQAEHAPEVVISINWFYVGVGIRSPSPKSLINVSYIFIKLVRRLSVIPAKFLRRNLRGREGHVLAPSFGGSRSPSRVIPLFVWGITLGLSCSDFGMWSHSGRISYAAPSKPPNPFVLVKCIVTRVSSANPGLKRAGTPMS